MPARIAPITGKSDVPAAHHAVVDEVLKVFGSVRGPFRRAGHPCAGLDMRHLDDKCRRHC